MNTRKRLKKDFDRVKIPSKQAVLSKTGYRSTTRSRYGARRLLTAPMIIMLAVLIVGCAAAGGVILHNLNFDTIKENTSRLTEVPEGYVGIYSKDDLVQMSRDVIDGTNAEKYILMADIEFTDADFAEGGICEGGWEPIDLELTDYLKKFNPENGETYYSKRQSGNSSYIQATKHRVLTEFNGNGHVIRNLRIHKDITPMITENEYAYTETLAYVGLFGRTDDLTVINLGMEDCEITVDGIDITYYSRYRSIRIGAIAATAGYVGGCYVKNTILNLHTSTLPYWIPEKEQPDQNKIFMYIGSLVGYCEYIDACYAENYTLNINHHGHENIYLYAGGIAGRAITCLTSWSEGHIDITGDRLLEQMTDDFVAYNYSDRVPTLIPKETFEELDRKLADHYGENTFTYRWLRAHFVMKDPGMLASQRQIDELQHEMEYWSKAYALATNQPNAKLEALYLFELPTMPHEIDDFSEQLASVFDSREEYLKFCRENNYMSNGICCYTYTSEDTATEKNTKGFDFESLWVIRDGRPRLKIFEN